MCLSFMHASARHFIHPFERLLAGSAVKMNGLSRLGEKKKKKSTSGMVLKRPKMPFKKQV